MWPEAFQHYLFHQRGKEESLALLESLSDEPITSVRLNSSKFKDLPSQLESVQWHPQGIYLTERPSFILDPYWHAGAYYVQEASSMAMYQVLNSLEIQPRNILDLCAAPGGKTTTLLDYFKYTDALVLANEVIASRNKILRDNLIRWGDYRIIVSQEDPKSIGALKNQFELILADVPCSGEGMFRKDRNAINEWSLANQELCVARQKRIIFDVWPALKNEGYLIYSTCTFNAKENEENLSELNSLQFKSIPIPALIRFGAVEVIHEGIYGYYFFPHLTRGEGFFISLLQKAENHAAIVAKNNKTAQHPSRNNKVNVPNQIRDWFSGELVIKFEGAYWLAQTKEIVEFLQKNPKLKVTMSGLTLADAHLKPDTSLALSSAFNLSAFEMMGCSLKEALLFLKKESFQQNHPSVSGYNTIHYHGLPLGFIKQLDRRFNNLYPKEWRILQDLPLALPLPWWQINS